MREHGGFVERRARARTLAAVASLFLGLSTLAAGRAGADSIERVEITREPARMVIHMLSGATCEPSVRRPFVRPPVGVYHGRIDGITLVVEIRGRANWRAKIIRRGPAKSCDGVFQTQGHFVVEVLAGADASKRASPNGSARGRGGRRARGTSAGAAGSQGRAGRSGLPTSARPDAPAKPSGIPGGVEGGGSAGDALAVDTSTATLRRRLRRLRMDGAVADRIADRIDSGEALAFADAMALLKATHAVIARENGQQRRDQQRERDRDRGGNASSVDDWAKWAAFLRSHLDQLRGRVRVEARKSDAMSVAKVRELLAEYKQHAGIVDPPVTTGEQHMTQVARDPALTKSWNALQPWEREMWNDYWLRHPDDTQAPRKSARYLRMTQGIRFQIALQTSVDYMGPGFRDAARGLFNDPVFVTSVIVGITLYAVAVLAPEPLFTKATAAAVTAFLLVSFSLTEIINMVKAWYQLRKRAGRATSTAALDAAAREFGHAMGGATFRLLLALFTYFGGKALPAPKVGTPGPTAAAVVTSGGGAAVATYRVVVIGGTGIRIYESGAVVIAPAAMASVAGGGMSSGGGGGGGGSAAKPAASPSKPSSERLGRALEAEGHIRPPGAAAHHIVPIRARPADPARKILARHGIGLDDAANGVFLPANKNSPNPTGAAVHSKLHRSDYYRAVNDKLIHASTRQRALDALDEIRQALIAGGFP